MYQQDFTNISRDKRNTKQLSTFAEARATEIRKVAKLDPEQKLDPFAIAKNFKAFVIQPEYLETLDVNERTLIEGLSAKQWSGGACVLPDGWIGIILNPNQTPERLKVTLMEEIAHHFLGHKPTVLTVKKDGAAERSYDADCEDEAYWTAAASLVPKISIGRAVWRKESSTAIASRFGVSTELVEFRIKTQNLWSQYKKYSALNGSQE